MEIGRKLTSDYLLHIVITKEKKKPKKETTEMEHTTNAFAVGLTEIVDSYTPFVMTIVLVTSVKLLLTDLSLLR